MAYTQTQWVRRPAWHNRPTLPIAVWLYRRTQLWKDSLL